MAPLAGKVAFTKVDAVPEIVDQDLNFYVTSTLKIAFEIQPIVVKGFAYFILGYSKDTFEIVWTFYQAYTTTTTTGCSLEHQGKTDLFRSLDCFVECAQHGSAGERRKSHLGHCHTRIDLVSHN